MVSDRPIRSNAYQYLLLEVAVDYDFMKSFDNSRSIEHRLNPFHYNEEYLELEDKLKLKIRDIINTKLTERQTLILNMILDGYTQTEIAKKLGIHQSSVTKTISGNTDYNNHARKYGGAVKKIRRIVAEDKEIQYILKRMDEILEEKL